jgi:hypothetical protein
MYLMALDPARFGFRNAQDAVVLVMVSKHEIYSRQCLADVLRIPTHFGQ